MAALESATPNVGKENAAAGVGKAAEEPAPNDPKPDDKAPATRPPEKGLKWAVIMEVRKGNADFLNEYLDGGADVELKEVSPAGRPLLCWAALGNQFECLKILVDRGADVDIKDCSGTTALNYVCRIFPDETRHEAVQFLLGKGADVNIHDNRYFSPLLHAAMTGDVPVLKTLVNAGADIERTDWFFNDAEAFAKSKGHDEAAAFLAEVKASRAKDAPPEAE